MDHNLVHTTQLRKSAKKVNENKQFNKLSKNWQKYYNKEEQENTKTL